MRYIFDESIYEAARESRVRNLFAHIDPATLAGKRVLELGCGTGELGEAFVEAGCEVVSVDAHPEYIEELKRRFPTRTAFSADLEKCDLSLAGQFDAVFCFGLLYHLSSPQKFLTACASIAPLIYLETAVTDSLDAICPLVDENGPDQAWSGTGCRPSPAWIEQQLTALGYEVRDISTAAANWEGGTPSIFDWTPLNDGRWNRDGVFLRKMWICSRPD